MIKQKETLRVQPWYTMVMLLCLNAIIILLTFLPNFLWEFSKKWIVWYIMFSLLEILVLIWLFKYFQYAVVDKKGITIKCIFLTIIKFNWEDISNIEVKPLITHDSRGAVSFLWIVFYSRKMSSTETRGGVNKKNKSPCHIIATKKNLSIMKAFISKYKTNL